MIGKLVRKKKRENRWVLAIRPEPVETESGGLLQPTAKNVAIPRAKGDNSLPYDFLFLFSTIRATLRVVRQFEQDGDSIEIETDEDSWAVVDIELLQCAPDPSAVVLALEGISSGRFPWTVIPALQDVGEKHDHPTQTACDILALQNPSRPRRLAIARLVRGLEKGPGGAVDKPARTRPPFIRPNECRLLKQLEALREQQKLKSNAQSTTSSTGVGDSSQWAWMEPKTFPSDPDEQDTFSSTIAGDDSQNEDQQNTFPLNLPHAAADQLSFRGNHTRSEYMFTKKIPQVRGMVRRVQQLFSSRDSVPHHIVDVGGGRCDLASALALAYPSCFVSVVDKNESSLLAGKEYARHLGVDNRMRFVCRDMGQVVAAMKQRKVEQEYNNNNQRDSLMKYSKDSAASVFLDYVNENGDPMPKVNLVVALHACGDLSDLALAFANELEVPFVVCPCCYTKRYISNFTPVWNQYCPEIIDRSSTGTSDDSCATAADKDNNQDEYRKSIVRLAEIDDNMHVSRLAQVAINSMRLCGMNATGGYNVSLEEYDIMSSRRNMVLVGYR